MASQRSRELIFDALSFVDCDRSFALKSVLPPCTIFSLVSHRFFLMTMTSGSTSKSHEAQQARSHALLEGARKSAAKAKGYDSEATRVNLVQAFRNHVGTDPYPWQVDATEAIIVGLDTIVIADTGAGKTMPFVMPLLDSTKKAIVISPLKLLQDDHVSNHHFPSFHL